MKRHIFAAALAALPVALCAQTALDAYSVGQSELRGTARFMSMGGAFMALGISSTLKLNSSDALALHYDQGIFL